MKHDINNLAVIPYIIADRALFTVVEADKATANMDGNNIVDIVDRLTPSLIEKAETVYQHSAHFRKLMNDKRKDQRYTLELFMEQWAKRLLKNYLCLSNRDSVRS